MNCSNEFGRLYASVCTLEQANFAAPAALTTITRTTGSTFRHAGSSMLVHADGAVVCALSGGCPQRDIVERAKAVIGEGRAQLARYDRESGLDVLIEMGCGGELEVLIEPLASSADVRFLHVIAQMHERRETGFMATVFARDDVVLHPLRVVHGATLLWSAVDARLSQQLVTLGLHAGAHPAAAQRCADPNGPLDVLIERLRLPQVLVMIGINAVSLALADLAATLGWRCLLVEHRGGSAPPAQLPAGTTAMHASPRDLVERIPHDAQCAVVVMTFDIEHDLAYLRAVAHVPLGYLGAIGSRARAARMQGAVADAGVHLNAPAGLDLGAENPQEIALAIAAEILAQGNARSIGSLSARSAAALSA